MKKSTRNSLMAGLGLAAVGSILVAQKRRRAHQSEMTSGYGMPQGGAGDEPQSAIGTMTVEEIKIEEIAEERLSE